MTKYTADELQAAWFVDLLSDAESAERQAETGPFYPERGITPESLRAYAADCRAGANQPAGSDYIRRPA